MTLVWEMIVADRGATFDSVSRRQYVYFRGLMFISEVGCLI